MFLIDLSSKRIIVIIILVSSIANCILIVVILPCLCLVCVYISCTNHHRFLYLRLNSTQVELLYFYV